MRLPRDAKRTRRRSALKPDNSDLRDATVDHQFRSGDERTVRTGEEQSCPGDLLSLAETLKGDLLLNAGSRRSQIVLAETQLAVEGRADRAGANRIHPDATRR